MLLWQEGCKKDRTDVVKCDTADKLVKALKEGTSTGDGAVVLVKATALHTGQKSPRTNGADNPSADCGLGICHRALQPYQIDLAIKGVFFSSTVVQLPNGGPPIVLPLERAPFVKTEHKVVLQSGQITSAENKKPSSAAQFCLSPGRMAARRVSGDSCRNLDPDSTAHRVQHRRGQAGRE